jgi:hypothetical protein
MMQGQPNIKTAIYIFCLTMTSDVSKQLPQVTLWRWNYFPLHSVTSSPPFEITGFNVFMPTLAPQKQRNKGNPANKAV